MSFIFCLPQTPVSMEHDNYFGKISASKIHSFIIPSNVHFEHKVLKKIPLLEGILPVAAIDFAHYLTSLEKSIPDYTHSKTSHFISSSFARGPPLHA